jgi:hypothetical protein
MKLISERREMVDYSKPCITAGEFYEDEIQKITKMYVEEKTSKKKLSTFLYIILALFFTAIVCFAIDNTRENNYNTMKDEYYAEKYWQAAFTYEYHYVGNYRDAKDLYLEAVYRDVKENLEIELPKRRINEDIIKNKFDLLDDCYENLEKLPRTYRDTERLWELADKAAKDEGWYYSDYNKELKR